MLELSATGGSGQVLGAGERVRTEPDAGALAEVTYRHGALTRLDGGAEIVVEEAAAADRDRVVVSLVAGRVWHDTGELDRATVYEARSPAAVVTARHAVFVTTVDPDTGAAEVSVVSGTAIVQGAVAGSAVVSDGECVAVPASGWAGEARPQAPDAELAAWVALNRALEAAPPAPAATPDPAGETPHEPGLDAAAHEIDAATNPLPRWATLLASMVAAAAFVAVLAMTFLTAQRAGDEGQPTAAGGYERPLRRVGQEGRSVAPIVYGQPGSPVPSALPPGAMAMIRAAQDRRVAPEPPDHAQRTAPTAAPPAAPPTTAAPQATSTATATATATSCVQRGRTVVLSGTLTNTGPAQAAFTVTASFTTRQGSRFATAGTTVGPVAPGATVSWRVQAAAHQDLRGSGASCDVTGVRPA